MTAKLIQIGNSRGVRLPKTLIEQTGLGCEISLNVKGKQIIIESVPKQPRDGWEEAFKKAVAKHGSELTDEDRDWLNAPLSSEADKDWTW